MNNINHNLVGKIEEINKAFYEFKSLNERKLESLQKNQSVDPLLIERIERVNDRLDCLESYIQDAKNNELHNKNYTYSYNNAHLNEVKFGDSFSGGSSASINPSEAKFKTKAEEMDYKNFMNYLIKGDQNNLMEFRKNNSEDLIRIKGASEFLSTQNDGGVAINHYLYTKIIEKITAQSPMRKLASVINVSSSVNEYIQSLDDINNGGWVNETQNRVITEPPILKKIQIKLHEVYANPQITQQLLSDNIINIENWIINKIASSFKNLENETFLFGNGVDKPLGLLSYNDKTADDKYKIESFNISKSSANGGFNLENLMDLMLKLEHPYNENASWLMSYEALRAIRTLKDSTSGMYLWQPAFNDGLSSSLFGYPVVLSRNMPSGTNIGDVPVVFGDFKEGFLILDSNKNIFLRDQFSAKPFVLFYVTKRVGAAVVNPRALKMLKIAEKA